jgi:hypothetical protein
MKNNPPSPFLAGLVSLNLCAAAALLCSCAASSVKQTWKAPDAQRPAGKIAVLAIDDRGMVRQGVENRFATQLTRAGRPAGVTYDQLSLAQIKDDKNAAVEHFRANGAETLLLVRLAGTETSYREVRPGGERYAETITGIDPMMGWYGYYCTCYSVAYMDMSPTYGNLKQKVNLEANLFDLESEKRLWTGLSLTVVKETMDRTEEVDALVAKFVAAMQKDGMIP